MLFRSEEHGLIEHLRSRGASVPAVLADEDGETAIAVGEWTYEVHAVARGMDVYEQAQSWTPFLNAGHAHAAGRALAKLHAAARDYAAPPRRSRMLVTSFSIFSADDPVAALERYAEARPALAAYLAERDWRAQIEDALLPFHERLRPWLGYLCPLWTHNDLHASNLLWSSTGPDAEVVSVIDFGLSDRTSAAHDIATAIERNGVEWLEMGSGAKDIVHLDQIDALLAGYDHQRPLSQEEAQTVVRLLPLVHGEFALAETDYFLAILHSDKSASLAYDGYLLGHAKWFTSDAGKRLLEHLEAWASQPRSSQVAKLEPSASAVR